MRIKSVKLTGFRNYETLDLSFHDKVNLILGNNGHGKTNLLEALYITSIGKSFRTPKDSEMVRFGSEFAKVSVTAARDEEDETTVEIMLSRDGGKAIKIDGVKARRTSELLDNIHMVVFSPEDLKIVKDEPEKRRRFIDRELCQMRVPYYDALAKYKKALKQRNAYLKEERIDENALDVWDAQLAEYGGRIIKERAGFVEKLNEISRGIHESITSGRESLETSYEANIGEGDDFAEILKKARRSDVYNRTTGRGPHRDDLKLEVNGIDIRVYGSQGQQRTAALSLKLAELEILKEETGDNAILLLDDVLSELDGDRQNYLINTFEGNQLFITAADISEEVAEKLPEGRTIYIKDGEALRVRPTKIKNAR